MIEGHTHMKYKKGYDYYSQEEKDTSNYILGKYGPKAQAEYLENIAYRQEQKKGQEISNSLKDADLLSKNIFAFLNGFLEKPANAIQGVSATGENKNVFLPSAQSIGIDKYMNKYASGADKVVIGGADWLGQTTASAVATAVNPAFGVAYDSAADYGEGYSNSLMYDSSGEVKDDIQKAQDNAFNNMSGGLISKAIFQGMKIPVDNVDLKGLKKYIEGIGYPALETILKDLIMSQFDYDN